VRIAVIIVLATISYWLAAVKAIGIFLVGVIVLAAVVGSVYARFRLPTKRRRLEGHPVIRIGSWDIALSSWTVALTGGAFNAVDTTDHDDGLFRGVLGFFPRLFAQWLQTFAMKGQIAERDRIAILFTRNPQALVRALEKLNADQSEIGRVTRATAPLWIEFPSRVGGTTKSGRRLARETALDGRIAVLRELAGLAPVPD
jgi:hypothetical protein